MLLSWSLIYKHNFSPHRYYYIWNRDILYTHNHLENWFVHGIHLVIQLITSNGTLMSYSELFEKYGIAIPPREYALVFDAIPSGVVTLFRYPVASALNTLPLEPAVTSIGQICFYKKSNSNRDIRSLFRREIVSVPNVVTY